jgi:hypothetical protein
MYCLVLMGILRVKPTSQFLEQCHGVVSCPLNMDDLISNLEFFFVNSGISKEICNVF